MDKENTADLTLERFAADVVQFSEFAKTTDVRGHPDPEVGISVYVNEYWTSRQRAANVRPRLDPPEPPEVAERIDRIELDRPTDVWEDLLVFYHPQTLRELTNLRQYLLEKAEEGGPDKVDCWIRMVATIRLTGHSVGFFSVYTMPPNQAVSIEAQQKSNELGIAKNIAVGHYKPINSPRYVSDCHEYIFHLTKKGNVKLDRLAVGVEYQDKSNVTRWNAKHDLRCRGNTWLVPYPTIQNRQKERPHPATFPLEIPRMCIALHGQQRVGLLMDPFLGLGSTALACRMLGISFVGFDAGYAREAQERLTHFDTTEHRSEGGEVTRKTCRRCCGSSGVGRERCGAQSTSGAGKSVRRLRELLS